MRKVDQYAKDRQIGNGMSERRLVLILCDRNGKLIDIGHVDSLR